MRCFFLQIVVLALAIGWGASANATTTYVVQRGDILGSIAEQFGVNVGDIRSWNDLNGDHIVVGQALRIERVGTRQGGSQRVVVQSGETLGQIAARHNVTIDDLVSWNRGLDPDRIREGQELSVRGGRASRRVVYVVQSNDFLGRIAANHNVTIADIVSWNSGLNPDRIRNGQELVMHLRGPEQRSESVGRAFGGQLVNGEQLPPHPAFRIRNSNIAWGTNETISAILDGFDYMRHTYSDLPRLRMHDLSDHDGGRLSGHRSHQSGRDADVGYYHTGCGSTCSYESVSPSEIDVERQWTLFRYWIDRGLIDYVFVDYRYQEVLHAHAESQGATASQLREWFQYPAGRDVATGMLRHENNHRDHFHVRFSCAGTDDECR
ncbi:MAG: LysM repeat protein [Bradymonadia bacterium]|jgi:LysM repeat protein